MRKFLPFFFLGVLFLGFLLFPASSFAQTPTPVSVDGKWVSDPEVTFVGKTGARSGSFLDWTLQNYSWLCVTKISENSCDNRDNPIEDFWEIIRNISFAVIALFVLATAFILIITRGQSITVMRFLPRFAFIILLIAFSFSLVQFIYQVGDIIQGFFLRSDNKFISTQDLLYIGFDYESFTGFRRLGLEFEESAFISLLLVKLTAITYYVMTGLLLVRKIILWFFIIISPVMPLLLFYKPLRNTAKIWVGEFFRWLLYAPLFAIFLHGLVVVWRKGIPLPFDFAQVDAGKIVYPTAINILLGGPGQAIGINNTVNLRDTFALYVVALLMLWVVILLPFLLLKIFLDYLSTISFDNSVVMKQIMNRSFVSNPSKGIPPTPPPQPPGLHQPAGMARSLPFFAKRAAAIPAAQPIQIKSSVQSSVKESTEVLKLANLSIPRMRDIAKYETSMISSDISKKNEVSNMNNTLTKIANPSIVSVPGEREKFSTVREQLMQQKDKGNPIATSILSASEVSKASNVSHQAVGSQQPGAPVIDKIQAKQVMKQAALPSVNKVQQVSLEDYEEVRKLWTENYQTVEPPKDLSGQDVNREEWIKNDIEKINQAISLLTSVEPEKVNQGMEMVANILPFLLIGGFSKSEVIAYLKAKMEAGKSVMGDMNKKAQEEDSMVGTATRQAEAKKEMTAEEAIPEAPKEIDEILEGGPKSGPSGTPGGGGNV